MANEIIEGSGGVTEAGWHSIEAAIRCPKEYQFGTVRGIKTPSSQVPDYLAIGSLFHAGRARWFARAFDMSPETLESVKDAVKQEMYLQKLPISLEAERRVMGILYEYIDYWRVRARPRPLATEYKLGPAPLVAGDPPELWRTARIDDLSYYPEGGDRLWIGEGKTTSTDLSDTVNQYQLHGQTLLQAALYHMDPGGERRFGPIAGIMLDVVKKPYGKDRCKFTREPVLIPPYAIEWFVEELRRAMRGLPDITWDSSPRRVVTSCTRMIGRMRVPCQFRDLCTYGRSAALRYVLADGRPLTQHVPVQGKEKMPWE